jgi:hypothetical protein
MSTGMMAWKGWQRIELRATAFPLMMREPYYALLQLRRQVNRAGLITMPAMQREAL